MTYKQSPRLYHTRTPAMSRGRPRDDDDYDDDEDEDDDDDDEGEDNTSDDDGGDERQNAGGTAGPPKKVESPIVLYARHCNMLGSYIRRGPVNHPRVCVGRELLPRLRGDLHVWVKMAHAMKMHPSDMRILRRPGAYGHPTPKDQLTKLAMSSELLERELAWWHDKGNAELVNPENKSDIEAALSDYWKHRAKLKVMEVVNKRRKDRQQQLRAQACKRRRDMVPPPDDPASASAYTDVD